MATKSRAAPVCELEQQPCTMDGTVLPSRYLSSMCRSLSSHSQKNDWRVCNDRPGDWKYPRTHGIHVYDLSQHSLQMDAAFLMAIQSRKEADDENYVPVEGAPEFCETEPCNPDPAVNLHPGMMVFRSGIEVFLLLPCSSVCVTACFFKARFWRACL